MGLLKQLFIFRQWYFDNNTINNKGREIPD